MDNSALLLVVQAAVFSLVLSVGITHSLGSLTAVAREPRILARALLAVVIVVPVVAGVLIWALDLPVAVATGLAVLAASPGAPLTTKRAHAAGGDAEYAASVQLTLALLAVVITPLTLAVYYQLFDLAIARVTPWRVAQQVATVTFLPVVLGLLIQHFLPRVADRVRRPLTLVANGLFLVMVLLLVVGLLTRPPLRQMLAVGVPATIAIVLLVGAGLTFGHALGGPGSGRRASLAIASIARNVGLALCVLGIDEAGTPSMPTVLVYLLLGAVVAVPYGLRMKRKDA